MQDKALNKQKILNSLAETMKELRGDKSLSLFSSENDISSAIVCKCEKGIKDPQLTTIFKLAQAYKIAPEKFIAKISKNLPENFSIIDD